MPIQGLNSTSPAVRNLGAPAPTLDRVPDTANAAELNTLIDDNWGQVRVGSATVNQSEGAWITQIAMHPNADESVLANLLGRIEGTRISNAARDAGFENVVAAIRAGASGAATPTTPGAVDVGVNNTSGPATNTSTLPSSGRPARGGNMVDIRAGGGISGTARRPVEHPPLAPIEGAVNPFRHEGELTYTGDKLVQRKIDGEFNGVPVERFGTTEVTLPDGRKHITNDALYPLGDGKVGMHFIGAKDGAAGSAKVDAFLRDRMGLDADDPIYAFYNHFHPEEHAYKLGGDNGWSYKTQQAFSHSAAYLGRGRTTNSPAGMNNSWNFGGTANNMSVMSLKDTDQATLNKNAHIVDKILNHKVAFAGDYKDDNYTTADLNTTLMFYRDWIRMEPHVTRGHWRTYCAEHKTVVANVMVNVPHNEAAFREIFGSVDGKKLWSDFKDRFKRVFRREFTAADETHFEPLWKKEGLTPTQIRPWKDEAEYKTFTKARRSGELAGYGGFVPVDAGVGMVWPPETTADLIHSFVELYAPVRKVGGPIAVATLMAFKDQVKERIGISDEQYLALAGAVGAKVMIADAMMLADGPEYMREATGKLYVALGGDAQDLLAGTPDPQRMGLVQQLLEPVGQKLPEILAAPNRPADAAARAKMADTWLQTAIQPDLEVASGVRVPGMSKTEFNSAPAIFHRASVGNHTLNPNVTLQTVATIIDEDMVE